MVYKPTRQRQYKVEPIGIVPMTGLRRLGAVFGDAADSLRDASDDFYKSRLADAEYEIALKAETSGAIIDPETGRLQDYAPSSIDAILEDAAVSSSDRQTLRRNYEVSTKKMFAAAIYNDAITAAGIALNENPADPDAITERMAEYVDEFRESTDDYEFIDSLRPEIARAFSGATSKARINQQNAINDQTVLTATKAIQNLTNEIATIAGSGLLQTSRQPELLQQMSELKARRDEAIKTLTDRQLIDADAANELLIDSETEIAGRAALNELTRTIGPDGDLVSGLELIDQFAKASVNETGFNVDQVVSDLNEELSNISKRITAETTAIAKAQDEVYQSLIGNIDNISMADIEANKKKLSGTQFESLRGYKRNLLTTEKAAIATANDNRFDELFYNYQYGKPELKMLAASQINIMHANGKLSPANKTTYAKLKQDELDKAVAQGRTSYMYDIFADWELGPPIKSPEYWQNKTAELRDKGFIGGENGIDESTWLSRLKSYATRYNSEGKDAQKAAEIAANMASGVAPNKDQQNWMQTKGFEPDFSGLLSDPTTAEYGTALDQSIKYAVNNGYLPKNLNSLIGQYVFAEDSDFYNRGLQAFTKFYETAYARGKTDLQIEAMLGVSGIKPDVIALMMQSRLSPQKSINDLATRTQVSDTSSSIRSLDNLFDKRETNKDEFFDKMFSEAFVNDDDLFGFLKANNFWVASVASVMEFQQGYELSERHAAVINQIKEQHGVNSVSNVLIADPFVKKLVMERAYQIYTDSSKGLEGPDFFKTAIRQAVIGLGQDAIGLTENSDGEMVFSLFPIEAAAQRSAGMHPVTITRDDIDQELFQKFWNNSHLLSDDEMLALKDGRVIYVPNKPYGTNNTYTAKLIRRDDSILILDKDFTYDFATSRQGKVWKAIEHDLKNEPSLYQLLARTNMLRDFVQNDYYRRMNKAQQKRSIIAEMANKINEIAKKTQFNGGMPMVDPNEYTDEDVETFFRWFGHLTGLGDVVMGDDTKYKKISENLTQSQKASSQMPQ